MVVMRQKVASMHCHVLPTTMFGLRLGDNRDKCSQTELFGTLSLCKPLLTLFFFLRSFVAVKESWITTVNSETLQT